MLVNFSLARRVATVSDLACEIEAVLRPSPYLPRSDGFRTSVGLLEPTLIASTRRPPDIPQPSSRRDTQEAPPAQWKFSQTSPGASIYAVVDQVGHRVW